MRPMQTPHRFLTTSHQRRRLALWALAMLSWLAAVLFAGTAITRRQLKQRLPRVSMARLRRLTLQLLMIRAHELAQMRTRKLLFWRFGRDRRRRHIFRSLLGSKVRRLLAHRDRAARIHALIGMLRNLDAHARKLAARMRRRLTRLWAIAPAPAPTPLFYSTPARAPAFADSS